MPRVVIFFAYAFGIVLVPIAFGLAATWIAGPRLVSRRELLQAEAGRFLTPQEALGARAMISPDVRQLLPATDAAAMAVFPDETRVLLLDLSTNEKAALSQLWSHLGVAGRGTGRLGQIFITNGSPGLIMADGPLRFVIIGPSRQVVDARAESIPALVPNPRRESAFGRIYTIVAEEKRALGFAVVLLWAAVQFLVWGRVASWAGGTPAVASVAPISGDDLRNRLLALNGPGLPFSVSTDGASTHLIVDWRYAEPAWVARMPKSGRSVVRRIHLRFDDHGHRVRAMDYAATMDWGPVVHPSTLAQLKWRAEMGITFIETRREVSGQLRFNDGRFHLDSAAEWRFDLNELKAPVIATITGAGWHYRPVITFFRPIGG